MNIEEIAITGTFPDPNNARIHSQKNIDSIKGSLTKFGQQKPIVIDEDGIVLAGNGTREAALELGWKNIFVVRSSLSDWKATAYALADNRTAELADWDQPQLDAQLLALDDIDDFDITDIGFDDIGAWDDESDAVDKVEENTDGITSTVKCEVDQESKDGFKEWLTEMIKDSGYVVKIT